ncbi:hydroxypyruvate isomerase [Bordetella ansorpii]|uniref:Hydroxypyruvate isomerase n=1 Tax=Bordetella ansorpii TaxID=288768 RepID=A0A157P3L0_9BORD|nr:2-oxo-tetronate isomerase [Bordetella ansorpii]SAI27529.1 hydroxypyruvate isomerase [Bordetella ansorpii]
MSLQFAANLSFLYQDLPFLDRIDAAARDGFKGVEYVSPLEFSAPDIRQRLDDNGVQQVLFNAAVGQWSKGERGIGALPGHQAEFRDAMGRALEYAGVLGNRLLHVMAGLMLPGADRAAYVDAFQENLAWAAPQAAAQGVTLLLEPINQRDMPGYFLSYQDDAIALIDAVGASNIALQFDCYHCQIMEGDVVTRLRALKDRIGHIQIASVPGRHEPDGEELNYPFVFETLRELGYEGWIGCEYKPRAGTSEGLGWLRSYREAH